MCLAYKNRQLMPFREIIAVCSETHRSARSEFLNVKTGTLSERSALMGSCYKYC
jgi:hypothetical protein